MIRRLRDDRHMTGDVRRYKVTVTRGRAGVDPHTEALSLNTPVVCGSCGVLAAPALHNVGDCERFRERAGR